MTSKVRMKQSISGC